MICQILLAMYMTDLPDSVLNTWINGLLNKKQMIETNDFYPI